MWVANNVQCLLSSEVMLCDLCFTCVFLVSPFTYYLVGVMKTGPRSFSRNGGAQEARYASQAGHHQAFEYQVLIRWAELTFLCSPTEQCLPN